MRDLKRENKMQPFISFIALLTLISTPTFALTGRVINQTLNRPEPDIEVSYVLHETGNITVVRDTTDSKGQFLRPGSRTTAHAICPIQWH